MNNLNFIIETSNTGGFSSMFLHILSLISILSSILVITTKNPIVSVLYLIGLFLAVSIYLILIGMGFIGLAYLLVYVGAVSILFLFILMLINIRISEFLSNNKNSTILTILVALCFNNILYKVLPFSMIFVDDTIDYIYDNINYITFNTWDSNLWESSHISTLGNILYTNYHIWLIIVSFILLLSMIGAIIITIEKPIRK